MKYGMRERISGGIILVAIAVILVLIFFGRPGHHKDEAAPEVSFNQQPLNAGTPTDQPLTLPTEANATPSVADQGTATLTVPSGNPQEGAAQINTQPLQPQSQPAPVAAPSAPAAPVAIQSAPVVPAQPAAPLRPAAPAARPAPAKPAPTAPAAPVHKTEKAEKPAAAPKPEAKPKLASGDPIMNAAQRSDTHAAPAPAPVKPAAPAASAATPADGWSVQAGSFGNSDNAQRLVQRLSQSGFKSYTLKRDPNTVVLVGPFATSQAAEEVRTQMQQRAGTNGLVVRNGKH